MTEQAIDSRGYNVLFICTANSARSILAEAAMNSMGNGRFKAFSAGSNPSGEVHPMTINVLRDLHIDPVFARSKSWDEFSGPDLPEMHFVFTVCDTAAGEACPIWTGHPLTGHWGVADPKLAEGNEAEIGLAFADTLQDARKADRHFLVAAARGARQSRPQIGNRFDWAR